MASTNQKALRCRTIQQSRADFIEHNVFHCRTYLAVHPAITGFIHQHTNIHKNTPENKMFAGVCLDKRRARDSNPQPLAGQLISNQPPHQFGYPPGAFMLATGP